MLDLSSNGELNPLGYNHDLFLAYLLSKDVDNSIINGFSADNVSSAKFTSLIKSVYGPFSPEGLKGITLVNQRNATGQAVQAAMIERSQDSTNGWSALYFEGSNHGSPLTLGGCICRWPTAAYPASANDESQALENVRNQMKAKKETASPVAAVVVEPTQQSTGHKTSN